MNDRRFPGILGEIAEAVGEEAALKIREAFGGRRITLPGEHSLRTKVGSQTKLVEVVGIEVALKIADAIVPTTGIYVNIPRGATEHLERRRAVLALSKDGLSVSNIAKRLGLTERTVYRIRQKASGLVTLSIDLEECMSSPLGYENFALGAVTLDVAAAGGAPAWVKVAPRGAVVTRDGRSYQFDPEKLVSRFAADGIDLPVDLDHAIARKTLLGERADAVGWVKELQARLDGLYARVEWLTSGLSVLASRTHRFVSPTFRHDDAGAATWLHSIALVAAPALSMPALASAFGKGMSATPDPIALAAAAHDYQIAQAASGHPICYADAVLAVSGESIDR
ncbi:MAG: helix-turn-helix domain-containing protein [Rhodoplanes sp.]|uniref:phage protease n=1 Tax=Rhodoplanes sp. TaxID=1968906 RepID=UPI00179C919B|nr:phage protease [Rhodoplanes sp.]NVO16099.1 helix-turn-helix domain-containing protein [Rhodoplanes sp.]